MNLAGAVALSWSILVIVYVATAVVSLLLMYWVIRMAILSALAEDRRRLADEARFLRDLDSSEE